MQEHIPLEKRIYELKKLMSILEWDIPHIQNNQLKAIREEQLRHYKMEFQELLEKTERD